MTAGKTTCETKQVGWMVWPVTSSKDESKDYKTESKTRRMTRRRQTPANLLEMRARAETKHRQESGGELGYFFRVTKTRLYMKVGPPQGGHSVVEWQGEWRD